MGEDGIKVINLYSIFCGRMFEALKTNFSRGITEESLDYRPDDFDYIVF